MFQIPQSTVMSTVTAMTMTGNPTSIIPRDSRSVFHKTVPEIPKNNRVPTTTTATLMSNQNLKFLSMALTSLLVEVGNKNATHEILKSSVVNGTTSKIYYK
ncbi:MAG: hypothetical protein EXS52_00390 [Candidatus Staskawiczbacteria bacterium]|nr:hypothetical protein [Candidatus Staskawiczbacteria bacterium]